ncbi:Protein CBG24205 [Caenorhabditis briggsae]|uniref:Protein CBG24205 n=1 Tax=Caenorhabditis briggsae TaxID=6238 RepID=A8WK75_CAEBR|nr:Protein CBG24205 [Caenorhabditis briggsae]CAP20868.2 Protein CBG24205 [Caenorhabditis briggsae]
MSQNFSRSDFDKFDNSTKEALVIIGNNILLASQYFTKLNFVLASIGVFINAFHIIVLSRKSMISNVINVILLGIAISDIVNLSLIAYQFVAILPESFEDECTVPKSYFITRLNYFLLFIKDDFRRLSAWLGVLMASVRYFIIKNSLNPKFNFLSKPSSGWKSLTIAFIVSTLMSMFYVIRVDLISEIWIPPEACGYPTNFSMTKYGFISNKLFFSGPEIYMFYVAFDGILKCAPSTSCLADKRIEEGKVSRKKTSVVSKNANNPDNTSKLVIIMTITCICAEGPMGIGFVFEALLVDAPKLIKIVNCFEIIIFAFAILNATTHFFVCFGVSTPYRKSVKELLWYKGSQKPITISPKISSASIVTTRKVG